ncbi:MAG: hypothetical protein ACRDLK_08670 [Gaiellaceae bacterium]
MKLQVQLKKFWARLTGATGDVQIDDTGAGLDYGGAGPSAYYAPDEDRRPE